MAQQIPGLRGVLGGDLEEEAAGGRLEAWGWKRENLFVLPTPCPRCICETARAGVYGTLP
jgi:hypothetical protein